MLKTTPYYSYGFFLQQSGKCFFLSIQIKKLQYHSKQQTVTDRVCWTHRGTSGYGGGGSQARRPFSQKPESTDNFTL